MGSEMCIRDRDFLIRDVSARDQQNLKDTANGNYFCTLYTTFDLFDQSWGNFGGCDGISLICTYLKRSVENEY